MFKFAKEHRANLEKLATFLEGLPEDYQHFNMVTFACHNGTCEVDFTADNFAKHPKELLENCGTVACALGHGPAAGVPVGRLFLNRASLAYSGIDWDKYAKVRFGINREDQGYQNDGTFRWQCGNKLWQFLFGPYWEETDNTPHGAAARIRFVLDGNDLPSERFYRPEHYESYLKVPVAA